MHQGKEGHRPGITKSTYLHVAVNVEHKRFLSKVCHDVVLLLFEADDGIQFPLDFFEVDVLKCDSCVLSAVCPDKAHESKETKLNKKRGNKTYPTRGRSL